MKQYIKHYSSHLQRDMEVNRYGDRGVALVAFPCERGRFYDYEDQQLISVLDAWICSGRLQVICVDSVDAESWSAHDKHPHDRALRQHQFDAYVSGELLPYIGTLTPPQVQKPIMFGCSMGGYHAMNTALRHPHQVGGCISLSGVFDLIDFLGEYTDELVHQHVPVRYLSLESREEHLKQIRELQIVICAGQGNFEQAMVRDAKNLQMIMHAKAITPWVDLWGGDVHHDWPWWKQQLPYFLSHMKLG